MECRTHQTALGCVDCDFKCCTVNEMCRHIFSTRHGARKCPKCDTYIVPRAFHASLQKLIERRRERTAAEAANIESTPQSSPEQPSSTTVADKSPFSSSETLTSIAVSTHPHLADEPNFRCFEKVGFSLQGDPRDYGLRVDTASDAQSGRASASLTVTPTNDSIASAAGTLPFRCMDCLNYCPTWTQVTRHIEQSGHTLPVCVQCNQHLKCFGPMRPPQHEINCGHCGFYGVFYTRRDYQCKVQTSRSVYNSANLFTGLSTLQYRCVCGISFLHPVHLAEHLRRVHHVTCLRDFALCHCCGISGPLAQMMVHIQHPCWGEKDGTKSSPAVTPQSVPENPIAAAAVEIAKRSRCSREKDPHAQTYGLDDIAAMTHMVEVPNFSGAAFLKFLPLLPPMSDDEVPLISEAHALSNPTTGIPSSSTSVSAALKPSYVVLYQCEECLFLFSTWDRIVQHIRATGHCRTYCAECGVFLPELLNYTASEGSNALRSQQQQRPHHLQLQQDVQLLPGASSSPIRSTTLAEHIDHLHRHGDIIGFPASPETLEVLVDVNAACYRGSLDPPPETFTKAPRTLMVYQCPAQHEGCYKVFLSYGDFVAHLLTSGHGTKLVQVPCADQGRPTVLSVLPTCYPMVTYRAKFTVAQLCAHFDFAQCAYCETAIPKEDEELHASLCVQRRRHWPGQAN
ncbi:hypothetical protein ABL78_5540 [Leptomonas seymouri]|uniref:C2H2-type domain-containing protein n=1 Tax=Leptomonas seymouri TaxID=5684 RepID=A0A0N1I3E5_LEPSE|nr:hypothetical protein ABL78_5540 [Leptomonas seymouri]|eukprot:KPI85415.1 hypothetical protein ABL78_5540 [Leptomonas seymouri]